MQTASETSFENFYKIDEVSNLYIDAIVGSEVTFLSAWGTDTAIKEFLAKLSLPAEKGGIEYLLLRHVNGDYAGHFYPRTARLEKQTGRFSKPSIFGELIQLWLYDGLTIEADYINRECILLKRHSETAESFNPRLWQTVMHLCPVPLLNTWHSLIEDFREKEWIQETRGIQIDAVKLDFSSDAISDFISEKIREGKLSLSA